jgi:hypothetical protein
MHKTVANCSRGTLIITHETATLANKASMDVRNIYMFGSLQERQSRMTQTRNDHKYKKRGKRVKSQSIETRIFAAFNQHHL